ncbi:MAG: hypothetical protein QXW60_06875 [Nitrososphaerota archaeon]
MSHIKATTGLAFIPVNRALLESCPSIPMEARAQVEVCSIVGRYITLLMHQYARIAVNGG